MNPNDVTDGVKEILGRGGWSSGNHMGFFFLNWGTTGDNAYFDENKSWLYCSATTLAVLRSNTLTSYKYTIFYNKIE